MGDAIRGRPREIEIDLEMIETLARLGCTQEEIAWESGVKPNHFCELKKKRPEIQEAIDKGKANLKKSIRHAQVKAGVNEGNIQMLIHLGKAYLNQSDKLDVNQKIEGEIEYEISFGDPAKPKKDKAPEAA